MAAPGESSVVYFPDGGEVTLDFKRGSYRCRCLDAESASWTDAETAENATELSLRTPDQRNQVVVITTLA